ncbi:hypothetical protein [Methanoculleus sp.]|uniref:hypothetical protein n=1 Tax=Methanoculleus sp. TaxID=90427 RepID=UPI0025CFBA93|nr:hypothetical protein [Methanoculleus sp.]
MDMFSFRRVCSLLVIMLVASAVLVASASAEVDVTNEQMTIVEKEQTVHLSVNEATPWNSKAAATIEEQIDNILANAMVLTRNGLSTYNVQYVRVDTLQTPGDEYSSASGSYRLYKVNEQDPNYDYYILWMKATGLNNEDGLIPSYLREVKPGVSLSRYSDVITDWEPITDTATSSGVTITASLDVSHGGVTAGISETFDLQQGHVGPDELSTSGGGYFKPHWNGNYQGSQGLIGGAEFRVPQGTGYDYDLSLSVTGAGY